MSRHPKVLAHTRRQDRHANDREARGISDISAALSAVTAAAERSLLQPVTTSSGPRSGLGRPISSAASARARSPKRQAAPAMRF
eukprot:605422-Pyramimonas_sp.AAC.2